MSLPFTIHFLQTYPMDALTVSWHDSPCEPPVDVVELIERSWVVAQAEAARHGRDLFPGRMTRLIRWSAETSSLHLDLGPTDYRAFVGTNLRHPELAGRFGTDALANPLGLSVAVITADNQILLQKRSEHVFEFPGFFHVGGGNVEPIDVASPDATGIIASIHRELDEELAISAHQITRTLCLGLAENAMFRKPDLLIATWVSLSADVLASRTNAEYSELVFLADDSSLSEFLIANAHTISPAGIACLLALGWQRHGVDWFDTHLAGLRNEFGRVGLG